MVNYLNKAKLEKAKVTIGNLQYDPVLRELVSNNSVVHIEPKTQEVLELLLQNVGTPISTSKILDLVWESDFISKNVISNRIGDIRSLVKKHDTISDPYKVLVTYPRKGYYFSLDYISTSESILKKEKSRDKHYLSSSTLRAIIAALMLSFIICLSILKSALPDETQSISSTIKPHLLLNEISALDDFSKQYLIPIKASILNFNLNNDKLYLSNQDSPLYFMQVISDDGYWPGAHNNINGDYILNIELHQVNDTRRIRLELEVFDSLRNTIANKSKVIIDTDSLALSLDNLINTIDRILGNRCHVAYHSPKTLSVLLNSNVQQSISNIIGKGYATDLELTYLSPFVLSSPDINDKQVNKWLSIIERSKSSSPQDRNIWLALLNYRLGRFKKSNMYFSKSILSGAPNNAFLYLVRSNVSLHLGDKKGFVDDYLRSISSLTKVLPPRFIYSRLSELNTTENCLSPWVELIDGLSMEDVNTFWTDSFSDYCERAHEHLSDYPTAIAEGKISNDSEV